MGPVGRWLTALITFAAVALGFAVAIGAFAVAFEEFLDEAAGLQTVEGFDGQTEHFLGHGFHVVFVEVVLIDQTEDEFLLLVRARPMVGGD